MKNKNNRNDCDSWSDNRGDKYNQGACIVNTASVIHGRPQSGKLNKNISKLGNFDPQKSNEHTQIIYDNEDKLRFSAQDRD